MKGLSLWDYVIDGEWMYLLSARAAGMGEDDAYWGKVSPFGWGPRETNVEAADWLLARSEFPRDPGRVPILICPLDGDLLCGFVSARLSVGSDTVRWSDLGYSWPNWDDDGKMTIETNAEALRSLAIVFDRAEYESAFADLLARVALLPSRSVGSDAPSGPA